MSVEQRRRTKQKESRIEKEVEKHFHGGQNGRKGFTSLG